MHDWQSREHLADHFSDHGREVGAATVEEFDASAQRTVLRATIFFYEDHGTGEPRIGQYDRATGLFAALNKEGRIVTHFRCLEEYVLKLLRKTYE